jgi:hypothetical protein
MKSLLRRWITWGCVWEGCGDASNDISSSNNLFFKGREFDGEMDWDCEWVSENEWKVRWKNQFDWEGFVMGCENNEWEGCGEVKNEWGGGRVKWERERERLVVWRDSGIEFGKVVFIFIKLKNSVCVKTLSIPPFNNSTSWKALLVRTRIIAFI